MNTRSSRPGFVFLLSILAVGVIGMATTVSLLLLGSAAERSAATIATSAQALENANTCVERAIRNLRLEPTYAGGTTQTLTYGTCTLSAIGGSGNLDRTICAQGDNRNVTRRLEVVIDTLYPRTVISRWREVSSFTLCP